MRDHTWGSWGGLGVNRKANGRRAGKGTARCAITPGAAETSWDSAGSDLYEQFGRNGAGCYSAVHTVPVFQEGTDL